MERCYSVLTFIAVSKFVEVEIVENVALGVWLFNVLFHMMIIQFRVDCSVRVCVTLVNVVNGVEGVKVGVAVVDVVDVDFKVDFSVKDDDDVDVEGVPDVPVDCSVARSKTWSPCTGWNTSMGLWYSLASKRLSRPSD